jgi:hypothetical protein
VLLNGSEWEDIVILLNVADAIETSKLYPNSRVEIFSVKNDSIGYTPTYNYYKNGIYFETK